MVPAIMMYNFLWVANYFNDGVFMVYFGALCSCERAGCSKEIFQKASLFNKTLKVCRKYVYEIKHVPNVNHAINS